MTKTRMNKKNGNNPIQFPKGFAIKGLIFVMVVFLSSTISTLIVSCNLSDGLLSYYCLFPGLIIAVGRDPANKPGHAQREVVVQFELIGGFDVEADNFVPLLFDEGTGAC